MNITKAFDSFPTVVKQRMMFNKLNLPTEVKKVEAFRGDVNTSNLQDIKGIWDATKSKLIEHWIITKEQLKTKTEEEIGEIITNPLSKKGIMTFINNI